LEEGIRKINYCKYMVEVTKNFQACTLYQFLSGLSIRFSSHKHTQPAHRSLQTLSGFPGFDTSFVTLLQSTQDCRNLPIVLFLSWYFSNCCWLRFVAVKLLSSISDLGGNISLSNIPLGSTISSTISNTCFGLWLLRCS